MRTSQAVVTSQQDITSTPPDQDSSGPSRPWALLPLWGAWLSCILVFAAIAYSFTPVTVEQRLHGSYTPIYPLHLFIRWDSRYYMEIAANGYNNPLLPNFYPVYPMFVRFANFLLGDRALSAFFVSWSASLLASYYLYRLATDYFQDEKLGYRAVALFLFAPAGFFLCSVYTESVFCALSFAAFYYARHQRWGITCALLSLVAASRLPGVVVAFSILIEYLSSKKYKPDQSLLWFLLVPSGLVAYSINCWSRLGDPLAYLHAYKLGWPENQFNWNILGSVLQQYPKLWNHLFGGPQIHWQGFYNDAIGPISWTVGFVLLLMNLRRHPLSFSVLMGLSLILFALNNNFQSTNRYVLPLFPIILGLLEARWLRTEAGFIACFGISASIMFLSVFIFTHGFWAG